MSKRFKIYSAPRTDDGHYCFSCDERMCINAFSNLLSMLQIWQDVTLPTSCTRFGMRYELSMTEFSEAERDRIGDLSLCRSFGVERQANWPAAHSLSLF